MTEEERRLEELKRALAAENGVPYMDASYWPQAVPAQPMPQPAAPKMPQPQQQQMGMPQAAQEGGSAWYKNPNLWDTLALGFNSMTMRPDPGFAQMIGNRMQQRQQFDMAKRQGNATAKMLRAQGLDEYADMIEANPTEAKTILAAALKSRGGGDLTDAVRTKMQTAAMLGLQPGSPEYNAFLKGESATKQVDDLRKEFNGLAVVKDFADQSSAYGRVVASAQNPSAAGDLALVFNFMKVLDPGSTVREGEFASASNAAGVGERVRNIYNRVLSGELLGADQRADFVGRAEKLYKSAQSQYSAVANFYAERADVPVNEFAPPYQYSGAGYTPSKPTVKMDSATVEDAMRKMTPEQRREYDRLRGM